MSHRTISIGGATYDLFVRLDQNSLQSTVKDDLFSLPLGAKVRVKDVIETCGGGASNTSVALSRFGLDAGFCGVIGNDQWGTALQANLEKEGVDTTCLTVVEGEVSSFSIILSASSGERVILYTPGTNEHLHDATFNREHAANVDWVYLNHIQASSCVIEDDIMNIISEENAPRFTWNPGGCQIDIGLDAENNRKFLKQTDLLVVNRKEALKFSKTETIEDAVKALIETGVHNMCITDGSNGTLGWDREKLYHCPVLQNIEVIDTTGAGDGFGSGATWALIEGLDLPTALKAGTINAASVVSHIGAQAGLLTHTEMQEKLERTDLAVTEKSI